MEEKTLDSFQLQTISDKASGTLAIKDYESVKELALQSVATIYVPEKITEKAELKAVKDSRALCNKVIKAIDRERIDACREFTFDFQEKCEELKSIIQTKMDALDIVINDYKEAQKLVKGESETKANNITAIVKLPNQDALDKLIAFCQENGFELTTK